MVRSLARGIAPRLGVLVPLFLTVQQSRAIRWPQPADLSKQFRVVSRVVRHLATRHTLLGYLDGLGIFSSTSHRALVVSETTLSKQGHSDVRAALAALDTDDAEYAVRFVDLLLDWCRAAQASDLHLQPTSIGLKVDCRLDGVLQNLGEFPAGGSTDPVARLKVMAQLLTYRRDVPQEGRIRDGVDGADMRVSTFPTLYGERAAVRFLGSDAHRWNLAELGLPEDTDRAWRQMLGNTAGALLITGPAGSGKTTTSYASLREIARQSRCGRSILSMEDPIEAAVTGVAQSQVNEPAGFTLVEGLRSILRQDPEVIFVGEIRDADSAAIAMQAALTGQLVLTTFHAESPASAISRLINLGVPPYVVASAVRGSRISGSCGGSANARHWR